MIVDALSLADPHLKIAKRIFNAEEYEHLTDHIMTEIESSKAPVSCYIFAMISHIFKWTGRNLKNLETS